MKNSTIILLVFLGILFIGAIITVFIIVAQKENIKKEEQNQTITLYLKALDKDTSKQIRANYLVQGKKGTLSSDSWTQINKVNKQVLDIFTWSEEYYAQRTLKQLTLKEQAENASKVEIKNQKIGNLDIRHQGSPNNQVSEIKMKLTSYNGEFRNLAVVITWTPGVLDINQKYPYLTCNGTNWVNYSSYNQTSETYLWLEKDHYMCKGNEEICEEANGYICKLEQKPTPLRFIESTDKMVYLGYDLKKGETINLDWIVRNTERASNLDAITFTFFDYDERKIGNEIQLLSEQNGENIAGKDYTYTINY